MNELLTAYCRHINFNDPLRPDLETLQKLHYQHTLSIPFENITPFTHNEVSLELNALQEKMLVMGRGGYCFEQNLLFLNVLKAIGFKVQGLGGRVIWNQPEDIITRRSHMLIKVELRGETYLADVGFGGLTQTGPLRLELDIEQKTSHESFRIIRADNDLKLQAELGEVWKSIYRFDLQEQHLIDYEVANFYLYTHPSSIFRNTLMAALPTKNGRWALGNNQLTFYPREGEIEKKTLKSADEIMKALEEIFKIKLPPGPVLKEKIELVLSKIAG